MKFEFPIKHMVDNIVINDNDEVWAYFKLTGFNYDFANDIEKHNFFQSQITGFKNEVYDYHFLSIPNPTNIEEIINRTIKNVEFMDYALKENGITLLKNIMRQLTDDRSNSETIEYYDYIGLQLRPDKFVYKEGNAGLVFLDGVKNFITGINSPLYQALGLKTTDILESELRGYKEQSRLLEPTLTTMFSSSVKAVHFVELLQIVELNLSTRTNNSDITLRHDFSVGQEVEGVTDDNKKHKAIRPNKNLFLPLQDVLIDEISSKELSLSRINEKNEEEEIFVQHCIASELPDIGVFPNQEWLYHIKTFLPFPIMMSIRANRKPNSMVLKELGNQKLEIKDQREEAAKGETKVDKSVDVAESGTIELENIFTRNGNPAFHTSIVFKIVANSKAVLNERFNMLKDRLTRFGITVRTPMGEQLALMTEMFAGGYRKNKDYGCLVDPGVLAGMMFGATTNIGDNRGFYIGDTLHSNKAVFIRPDLAAKQFDGLDNIVSSLAVLVAGMTGKGKSFFMNLFTYLSVMTMGAKALVIDPKGDRKGWEDGLPLIPKEHVRIWTLGNDVKDEGALDPFRTSINLEEGKSIAKDILAFLTHISIQDYTYGVLTRAVEYAAEQKEPCIEHVFNYTTNEKNLGKGKMSEKAYEELEGFVQTLDSLKQDKLSRLLFGKVGQTYNTLSHDTPLQVLMIENLTLPSEKEVANNKLRPVHYISEAILISITAWTKEYMVKGDRKVYKIILQDEANIIQRNPIGELLMDTINRQGRFFNTCLLQGAQNATDHKDNVSHIGMKFSFGLRKKEEAREMLDFLNLPITDSNVKRILDLKPGQVLFQDIYGRSAIITVNPVFEEIFRAFDTSTSTEEERLAEKEHMYI